jgi:(p)ppGpp synthase/HD superfamily hydrolase
MSYTQQDAKKESDAIVIKAIEMATEFHERDVRKGTVIPYLSHLFNVCKILAERDCRAELIAAALLHDIVEDTSVTIGEVENSFGKEVANLVEGATEPYKLQKTKFDENTTWEVRKKHTIDFISNKATPDQMLIILADKLDNIRSVNNDVKRLGEKVWSRFNADKNKQSWYYHGLVAAFTKRINEFDKAVIDLLPEFKKEVDEVFAT